MIKGILLGALGIIAVGIVSAYLFVTMGFMPANADANPGKLEKWLARKSLRATLKRQVKEQSNPLPLNDSNLKAGIKIYADNCLVCHGASGGNPSNIAKGLYQRPPQLAKHGVEDDPEERTYWVIEHGIRLTGMPSFGKSLDKNQIWKLCMFLKQMDSLSPGADKAWKALAGAKSSGPETPSDSHEHSHQDHEHNHED